MTGAPAVVLPNGVDLDRFRPAPREPEPAPPALHRLLRAPSQPAGARFLSAPALAAAPMAPRCTSSPAPARSTSWPAIATGSSSGFPSPASSSKVSWRTCGPAYERAAVVVAPLVASAGTNIKILEAMAMGKAIVSTPAGVNGLDLAPGERLSARQQRRGDGCPHRDPLHRPARPPPDRIRRPRPRRAGFRLGRHSPPPVRALSRADPPAGLKGVSDYSRSGIMRAPRRRSGLAATTPVAIEWHVAGRSGGCAQMGRRALPAPAGRR